VQDEDAAPRKVGYHGQGTRKTLRKVIADNFPQWVFSGAKVVERTRVTPGFVIAVGGAGPGPVDLLWRTQLGTLHNGRLTGRECRAGPGQLSVTDPSSITDRRSEFIYKIGGPKGRNSIFQNITFCFVKTP
jgi:hypothetical protein